MQLGGENLRHHLKTEDGTIEVTLEMGCGHPDLKNNSSGNIGCDGDCGSCQFSFATGTIPDVKKLLYACKCTKLARQKGEKYEKVGLDDTEKT